MSSQHPRTPADSFTSVLAQLVSSPESVDPMYQPIVELTDHMIVGYEALSRWPAAGSIDPVTVFDHARARGCLGDVEWACRLAAVQGALDGGVGTGYALFVNVEPDALDPVRMPAPPRAAEVFDAAAAAGIQLVVELTERTLLTDPATMLATVEAARIFGHAIALDDVGANDESLALLPLIAPDIVKLDHRLIHDEPDGRTASILAALAAHTERTDTIILAEGIETPAHLDTARAWGATLGQGCLFGPPAALPAPPACAPVPLALPRRHSTVPVTPAALMSQLDTRIADAALLRALRRHLEDQALASVDPLTIIATFQSAAQFTLVVAERYCALAARHPFVAALGVGFPDTPSPGVRGSAIAPGDPLLGQWVLTIIGHHYCVALIAREIDDYPPHLGRRFEYALTHDRASAVQAARCLTRSITPH